MRIFSRFDSVSQIKARPAFAGLTRSRRRRTTVKRLGKLDAVGSTPKRGQTTTHNYERLTVNRKSRWES